MDLYFTEGADLTDREVLVQAAAAVGLDADDRRARLWPATRTSPKSSARRCAKDAGIDGVPCFIFGGKFAVSGAQAPEYLAEAIARLAQAADAAEVTSGRHSMKITAAVVHERSGPFSIEQIDLCDPRADELLVEVVASGMGDRSARPRCVLSHEVSEGIRT